MIHPVDLDVVGPDWATRVVSPAYDSMPPGRRSEIAESNPYSYLNVTQSPGDIPGDMRPTDELLGDGRSALERLLGAGAFDEQSGARFYLYRLDDGDHEQVGLVADIDVQAYLDGLVRIHERTVAERESLLVRHLEVVGATSSPIALTYRHRPDVDALVGRVIDTEPILDFRGEDQLHQTVWRVDDPQISEAIEASLAFEPLYIIDGHHRAATAAIYRDRHPTTRADAMLGVLFPTDQLKVLGFNRHVVGTGMTDDELIERLSHDFTVTEVAQAGLGPEKVGEFGAVVEGRCLRLSPNRVPGSGPLAALDPAVLQEQILGPIFGIDDPSTDARLVHVPGANGPGEIVRRVDANGGVGFVLFPVPIDSLLAVADANGVMPPKSTYFTPKPRSGVFLRRH